MEATNKNGKVKVTFELEINEPAMELIKQNMDMMSEVMAQGMKAWQENRDKMGKSSGYGPMGHHGMMHHGQE
jgi:hypothetical protein